MELGAKNSAVIIPGYTHLQRAQPVYFAHHLLAYVEMLERDCSRLDDCYWRLNVCPLGSGAIAHYGLPNRFAYARTRAAGSSPTSRSEITATMVAPDRLIPLVTRQLHCIICA